MLNRLKGVFASFQSHDVRYVVIGGVAAILHGVPRATFGVDILIEATPENARRLLAALTEVGFGPASLASPAELVASDVMVFKDIVRMDVQTHTPGLTFDGAWERRERRAFEGQEFFLVSKADLIASKRAAGRPVDLEDVRLLELNPDRESRSSQQ